MNLSGRQFQHEALVSDVAAALAESRLDPARLVLEITESVIMRDTEVTLARLLELKALGVRLAIDDFGTGYASVSRLLESPFDVIKIDEALVHAMGSDRRAEAIVSGIIDLGRRLGAHTIAEGIEGAPEVTELRQMGCDYGQGFHFATALPAAELAEQTVGDGRPFDGARLRPSRRTVTG